MKLLVILWLGIFCATVILNFIIADFMFFGIAFAALVAVVLDLLKVSINFQIIIFGVLAVFLTMTLYPKIKKKLKASSANIKNLEEKYLGIEFILDVDVDGEVLLPFKGSYWTFKNRKKPLKSGEKVKIVTVDGNKLVIDKINPFRLGESGSL